MQKSHILRVIVEPVLTRVGSMLAGTLVGLGLAAEHGPSVQNLVVALGLLGCDLVSRRFLRGR